MKRVLFVSNGHGEVAVAARIAEELHSLTAVECDHLALVGDFAHPSVMRDVGPRRAMPSGGLIAMGNVRNIARDVRAGLVAHTIRQLRFLKGARGTYAAAVAVGDTFALLMALRAGSATLFVGTAKSVHVAPYGRFEERIVRRARVVYVRDDATAERLQRRGIRAQPGNVIVDLYAHAHGIPGERFSPQLALFPGSREAAYGDAVFLCRVVREIARTEPTIGATMSVAPGLQPERMRRELERDGWRVEPGGDDMRPFTAFDGAREIVRAWGGPIGAMLDGADAVLGQAGTANEAAAAAGIPVVAFAPGLREQDAWYRRRQAGLLGGALLVVAGDAVESAKAVRELLADSGRRARMGEIGRARMGPPGAARRIACDIAELIA